MSGHRNIETGAAGEAVAAAYYERLGWSVLDRNWRTRDGEIDLIVQREGMVAFCEVKTRTSDRYGGGAVAVTVRKQSTIRRVAIAWLYAQERRWRELRFDVVVVTPGHHGSAVELIEGAF